MTIGPHSENLANFAELNAANERLSESIKLLEENLSNKEAQLKAAEEALSSGKGAAAYWEKYYPAPPARPHE